MHMDFEEGGCWDVQLDTRRPEEEFPQCLFPSNPYASYAFKTRSLLNTGVCFFPLEISRKNVSVSR